MKKIMLSFILAAGMFVSANAEQAAPEACACEFDGISLGLGVVGNFTKIKNELTKEFHEVTATYKDVSVSKNANTFGGTVAVGFGKTLPSVPMYLGLETYVDFTNNKKIFNNGLKKNAFAYGVAAKIGYVFAQQGLMLYTKVGAEHSKFDLVQESEKLNTLDKIEQITEKASVSKFAPAFAIGVEKSFCKKFTAKIECAYRLNANKDLSGVMTDTKYNNDNHALYKKDIKCKFKTSAFTVRALCTYNIKI